MVAILPSVAITTAVTNQVGPTFQFRKGSPRNMAIQVNFTYGSAGTTLTVWIQSSLDGGTTWTDNARFPFTTGPSARQGVNLSSLTSQTSQTLTDGSTTPFDGIIGSLVRCKYTSTGTYAGTTLQVDCISDGLTAAPAGVHE